MASFLPPAAWCDQYLQAQIPDPQRRAIVIEHMAITMAAARAYQAEMDWTSSAMTGLETPQSVDSDAMIITEDGNIAVRDPVEELCEDFSKKFLPEESQDPRQSHRVRYWDIMEMRTAKLRSQSQPPAEVPVTNGTIGPTASGRNIRRAFIRGAARTSRAAPSTARECLKEVVGVHRQHYPTSIFNLDDNLFEEALVVLERLCAPSPFAALKLILDQIRVGQTMQWQSLMNDCMCDLFESSCTALASVHKHVQSEERGAIVISIFSKMVSTNFGTVTKSGRGMTIKDIIAEAQRSELELLDTSASSEGSLRRSYREKSKACVVAWEQEQKVVEYCDNKYGKVEDAIPSPRPAVGTATKRGMGAAVLLDVKKRRDDSVAVQAATSPAPFVYSAPELQVGPPAPPADIVMQSAPEVEASHLDDNDLKRLGNSAAVQIANVPVLPVRDAPQLMAPCPPAAHAPKRSMVDVIMADVTVDRYQRKKRRTQEAQDRPSRSLWRSSAARTAHIRRRLHHLRAS